MPDIHPSFSPVMKLHLLLALPALAGLLLTSCDGETADQDENQADQLQSATTDGPSLHPQFSAALTKVNALSPQDYPEVVTPLPEAKNFGRIDDDELMAMLKSWNPALRSQAAKALSLRGTEALGVLRDGTSSDNWMVRAGSATALASIIQKELQAAAREDQQAVRDKHADVIADFIRLAADDRREVRGAALKGLEIVAPRTPEALRAMLALINDPDDFIAQSAMITLYKRFGLGELEIEEVTPALRDALDSELPRGRGCIVLIIERMNPEIQRTFIPELLAHVDWQPRRDTMFAAGGQASAVKILAKLEEPQLIARLPKLMGKDRGPGFDVCLEAAKSFGAEAKVIVPELKAILTDIETNGKEAAVQPPHQTHEASLQKLRETIEHLEHL